MSNHRVSANKTKCNFKFPRPKDCPVCYKSLHQCVRPLECHHWVHRSCIRKSGKSQCPICRKELPDIKNVETKIIQDDDTDVLIDTVDIPRDSALIAVLAFKLYSNIIDPRQRILGLDHFVSGILDVYVPHHHPWHDGISVFLYAEALEHFFQDVRG